MLQRADVERYRENRQDEIDSAAEYGAMAASEPDPKIAKVYSNLAKMEEAHIAFWEDRLRSAGETVGDRRPFWRSRVIASIARRLGPDAVLSTMAAKEAADRNVYVKQPEDQRNPDELAGAMAYPGSGSTAAYAAPRVERKLSGQTGGKASRRGRQCASRRRARRE